MYQGIKVVSVRILPNGLDMRLADGRRIYSTRVEGGKR